MDGEGWQTVKGKKKRFTHKQGKMDIAGRWKDNGEKTNTFYFLEIPDTHGAREMLKAFAYYGEVVEVVIPSKRNSRGLRFGFARFRNVNDPRTFAVKLDNIIIGAKKIFVNIPKFHRENMVGMEGRPVAGIVKENTRKGGSKKVWRVKEGNKGRVGEGEGSGVKNNGERKHRAPWMERKSLPEQRVVYFRKKNLHELCYEVGEEDMNKYSKMYVGELRNAGSSHMVQEWFYSQGIFSVKATPLGANLVLLEELEEGIIPALISDANDLMYEKFEDVRGWSPMEYDNERVVWVRCHGIPVHAWNDEFFGKLARQFGVFLGVDENTRKKTSMDVARILVRTKGFDVFNMVVYANINGITFHIKVLEEWCGPMHWVGLTQPNGKENAEENSESEDGSDDDDGPPLFTEEDGSHGVSDEEEEDERGEDPKDITIHEGLVLENGVKTNHEGVNGAVGIGDVLKSLNEEVAHGGNEGHGEVPNLIQQGEFLVNVEKDNHEKVNEVVGSGEDECSSNGVETLGGNECHGKEPNLIQQIYLGVGPEEVKSQSCEVVG